ncbi:MAG: 2-hydroxyacyl-CoA dehydratase family protein [Firmicutes bacterium]|uniref:Benzoyl-CoA reductase subunit B n=1 Tax=Sulfobacillus benefaciens TaxID=453960 RepID=A0A2T2X3R0_9FIRM|nr:2-hydroxyacyl-CoA dehydratase family protein [Bacillota bacterium]PSR29122.1 MAG: benzoyl-CoA reductase subunit B [Sulfobacillus benefaciens]
MANAAKESQEPQSHYQGGFHLLQKELMNDYFDQMTRAAEGDGPPAVYLLISGNPVELIRAFDLLPVFPEINALQIAAKHQSLPFIQKAEEVGYSTDNCAYVKADVGLWYQDGQAPMAKVPKPDLLLTNYVGCNVYLHWWEHLAELSHAPIFDIDIPFIRTSDGEPRAEDITYVVRQLEELIPVFEKVSGKKFDPDKLTEVMEYSKETGELWAQIKRMTVNRPSPFDAYFDAVTMMGPLYTLRGTKEGRDFFRDVLKMVEEIKSQGKGPLPEEKFRLVVEGPPPWPYLRIFRDMFARWGAVFVASTYSTVGGLWEFGFSHDPSDPLRSVAMHMLKWNLTNRNFLQRYQQLKSYVDEWGADGLVIHSVKSCRLFSAGQGDMREYFARQVGVPTLLVESDLEDPRYFSKAQMRTRIDAFMESLEHHKLVGLHT